MYLYGCVWLCELMDLFWYVCVCFCSSKASWKRSSRTSLAFATSCWRTNPRPQRSSLRSFKNSVKKCRHHNVTLGHCASLEQLGRCRSSRSRWDDRFSCGLLSAECSIFVVTCHSKLGVSVCQCDSAWYFWKFHTHTHTQIHCLDLALGSIRTKHGEQKYIYH